MSINRDRSRVERRFRRGFNGLDAQYHVNLAVRLRIVKLLGNRVHESAVRKAVAGDMSDRRYEIYRPRRPALENALLAETLKAAAPELQVLVVGESIVVTVPAEWMTTQQE